MLTKFNKYIERRTPAGAIILSILDLVFIGGFRILVLAVGIFTLLLTLWTVILT